MLSPDQVQRYSDEGVVFPVRVFSAEEARLFRRGFEELEKEADQPDRFGYTLTPSEDSMQDIRGILHFRWVLAAMCAAVIFAGAGFGQSTFGSITGVVSDA